MANLDSSWQASVIKLAQTGNSRAIAFWLNRYLVPQGICAQIATEPTGCLAIQVVCRQVPDCDRLVRFICHRLCKLDSNAIQQVRISAQMVGSSQVLWEKSARIIPPSERPERQNPPQAAGNVYAFPQPALVDASGSVSQHSLEAVSAVAAPQPAQATVPRSAELQLTIPHHWTQFSQSWQQSWQFAQDQLDAWQTASIKLAHRSIRWFGRQKPAVRALMLGGSAVTAFLIGSSFELVGYYANPTAFQQSKATLTQFFRSAATHSGSVQTASERVAVIRQPVLNPDDPTVSLIFCNSDTLTRIPIGQLTANRASGEETPLVTSIETFRQADMIVTSLDAPLSPTSTPVAQTTAAEKAKIWKGVLEDTGTDSVSEGTYATGSIDPGEREAVAEKSDKSEAESKSESAETIPQKQKVPLMPQELLANGVDLVNIASDAVMPEGADQLTNTLNLFQQDGIRAVGAGQNVVEARRPRIFDVKGQRIAYLNYSDSSSRAASAATAGVNVSVNKQMEEDIKAIRDQVDWIVVSFNWNRELRVYPESWQEDLARAAIDNGADLVVGYHPTATQGAEIYKGRAIVYSLGDAVDEYSEKPVGDYDTAALKVTLKEQLMQVEFLPIQVRRGRAEVAKGELGASILKYLEQASSLFDQPLRTPAKLNSQVRLSLPAAPDAQMPTDPFIGYPESPAGSLTQPNTQPNTQPSPSP